MATKPRTLARLHVTLVARPAARGAARGLCSWLARVAPRRARGAVTIALVSDARMRALNRTFRGVDRATDVLSFPVLDANPGAPAGALGDIAIAAGVAAGHARAAGHALGTELRVLALHGLLHLLGFDHETDDGRMARTEATLRRAGRLTEGLIERARPVRTAAPRARKTTSELTAGRHRR